MTLPLLLAFAVLAAYLAAVARLRRRSKRWSNWRAASFSSGCLAAGGAFASPLVDWAAWSLQGHMLQHLLLGMLAPLGLALGAPLTLAYRALPNHASRRITRCLRRKPLHTLAHPATALALNTGGMFALYLTPLYALAMSDPFLHGLVHLHFLLAGCLFAWAIAGPDPAPRRPGFPTRLLALFIAAAAHAFLSKLMYAHGYPRGTLCGAGDLLAAAKLMYYGGDLAELLLAAALFHQWSRNRARRLSRSPAAPTVATA